MDSVGAVVCGMVHVTYLYISPYYLLLISVDFSESNIIRGKFASFFKLY